MGEYFDYSLFFVVLFLIGFGLLMVYSATSYVASVEEQNPFYYFERQAVAGGIGLVVMLITWRIPYRFWERFALPAYLVSVILLLMLYSKFGVTRGGATRWLDFGLPFNLQPAEVAKVGIILFLASVVSRMGPAIRKWRAFLFVLLAPLPICAMVYFISDNLSSAIILMGIAVCMLFVITPDARKLLLLFSTFLLAGGGVAVYIVQVVKKYKEMLELQDAQALQNLGFRTVRILTWLSPEDFQSDTGYQSLQALYAIGSGGIMGKGIGESMQKLGYIPEAQNDMIFSIICEELGLFGALAVMLMFLILIWRCMVIANNAKDLYGALLVVGVMGHISIQVILNIAVVTNTIPNTGISLPFISYGGSALLFLLIEIGLVMSVARGIERRES